jgi:simple sugar transport system ATP-binding protein
MPVSDNLLIGGYKKKALRFGFLFKPKAIAHWAKELVARFSVATGSIQDPVGSLSGGNQQKIVVARNLDSTPELLVAFNPTRGLDIQAANYVHEQILKVCHEGAAVVLFSTDLDELAAIADRSLFMTRGKLVDRMEDALGSTV